MKINALVSGVLHALYQFILSVALHAKQVMARVFGQFAAAVG